MLMYCMLKSTKNRLLWMNYEDLFRLHISGAGDYIRNELITTTGGTIEFIDGVKGYIRRGYYDDDYDRLSYVQHYSYDKMHGEGRNYFRNGVLWEIIPSISGWIHGERKMFNEAGILIRQTNYRESRLCGAYRIWDDDGNIIKDYNIDDHSGNQ